MRFQYRAKNAGGKTTSGTVNAENETDAVGQLRRQGLTVLGISAGKAGASGKGGEAKKGFLNLSFGGPSLKTARVKSDEMVVFTRQLSTMISAGIPVVEALEILQEQASNPGFKLVLGEVVSDLRTGKDISQAFGRHPRVFPKIYVNMLKAGEASGQLDTVLNRLAGYQEAASALRQEIKSAMTYPVVSLVLILGITTFLLVFIIPKFESMFKAMNVELPIITKALLATSLAMRENFALCMAGVVALVVTVVLYSKTERGRLHKDWLMLHLPVFGPLFSKVALSRFSRTFATLIQSGVPILGALEIVCETSGNQIVSNAIQQASESVRQGETLGEPLSRTKVFPLMVTRMIAVGERTGALESLLEKIAEFYDQEVKSTVESLTSLIEPLMIATMGVLVGGMVLAVFMPIFKMIGSIGHK
jgi:type IV pilus assembly protein PilC